MLDRRQRKMRRAISGGVMLATSSALLLWLIETGYVFGFSRGEWRSPGEALSFALGSLGMFFCLATGVGAVQGVIALCIGSLTKRMSPRRLAEPAWMASMYSLMAVPAIAFVIARLLAGRKAQQIAGRDLFAVLAGAVALVAVFLGVRMIIAIRERFRIQRWGRRQAVITVSLALGVAVTLYVMDLAVLPRLYAVFHVCMVLGAFAFCQFAISVLYATYRPANRRIGRIIDPGFALLVAVASLAGGAVSLRHSGASEALRMAARDRSEVQSKLMQLADATGLAPRPARAKPAVTRRNPDRAPPLRRGPTFPDANVLLITVDALRADHLGVHGYARPTSPNIDRWAKRASVFKWGRCTTPHTSFSLASLMTGRDMFASERGNYHTLARVFRRYDYKTAGFFPPAVFYIDGDRFRAYRESSFDFEYVKFEFLDAAKRVDQVGAFLAQHPRRKVFVWTHFFEPHEPYVARQSANFGKRAIDRYDSELAYVDRQIDRLIRLFRDRSENTIVALTSDHGEAFGEHGSHYHGSSLYEEQLRVPVIISTPDRRGRVIDGPAQVIDLATTLLAAVELPVPATMSGRDLGPWLAGEDAARLPPAYSQLQGKQAVTAGSSKLIVDQQWGVSELYDLRRDPGEQDNLAARRPSEVERLRPLLGRRRMRSGRAAATGNDEASALLARARSKDVGAISGLRALARSGDLADRREALRLLAALRAHTARAEFVAAASATNADPGLRYQGIVGAALLGHPPSIRKLPELVAREDLPPRLERDARIAQALEGDGEAVQWLVRSLARADDIYERIETVEVLGLAGDARAAPVVLAQLGQLRVRRQAIEALGRMGAEVALAALRDALLRDRFISIRRAAAEALGRIGSRGALGALRAAYNAEVEPAVVAQIAQAILAAGGSLDGRRLRLPVWVCRQRHCRAQVKGARCDAGEILVVVRGDGNLSKTLRVTCGGRPASRTAMTVGSSAGVRSGEAGPPYWLRQAIKRRSAKNPDGWAATFVLRGSRDPIALESPEPAPKVAALRIRR